MKNRKMNNRRRITEEFPESIDNPHLDYHVPLDEGMEDNTLFSDLLDEAEDFPEEDDGDEPDEEQQEEDAEMVESSGEEKMDDKESKEEEKTEDDPMGEEKEEGPEAKKRRVAKLVESIPNAASAEGVCLACGSTEHAMSECQNQDAVKRIHDAFGDILAKIKVNKQSFPKGRRSRTEKKTKERKAPTDDTPDRVISLYPEEIQTFQICADYQDGHWTALRTHTNDLGPSSHKEVTNEILPGMDVFDRSYRLNGSVNITQETSKYYVNIESMFSTGTLSMVPRDGVQYWHLKTSMIQTS